MALATHSPSRGLSNRIVLLKDFDSEGLTFYTNYDSVKGLDMTESHDAAAVFYWDPLGKQVRIRGSVKKTSRANSEKYWSTRPHESQVSQSISQQSRPVADRRTLEKLVEDAEKNPPERRSPVPKIGAVLH